MKKYTITGRGESQLSIVNAAIERAYRKRPRQWTVTIMIEEKYAAGMEMRLNLYHPSLWREEEQ